MDHCDGVSSCGSRKIDRELGTVNWGQASGAGNWDRDVGGSKLKIENLDRTGQGTGAGNWGVGNLEAASWGQGTGDRELGRELFSLISHTADLLQALRKNVKPKASSENTTLKEVE